MGPWPPVSLPRSIRSDCVSHPPAGRNRHGLLLATPMHGSPKRGGLASVTRYRVLQPQHGSSLPAIAARTPRESWKLGTHAREDGAVRLCVREVQTGPPTGAGADDAKKRAQNRDEKVKSAVEEATAATPDGREPGTTPSGRAGARCCSSASAATTAASSHRRRKKQRAELPCQRWRRRAVPLPVAS
ncbi:hypothetical protein GUJ93_ZPchr0003g18583 [Zizania palustris]|uniref:Uncharacterized protein n=1 Tax=Zizania palustris TaxID=103762 RepID=A0A8J5S771_ZIZPA|nr:hypothetical protein GUJ93_ZPchr0003g18583 [Zizania palustris]